MNLLDATSKFFGKKSTSTSGDIRDLQNGVTARLEEIERRQSHINAVERQRVLETGDAEAVARLDAEMAALRSEESALLARRSRLHQEFKASRAAEALANASKNRARLSEAVGSIQSMKSQLADAENSLQQQLNQLREQKQLAGNDPKLDIPHQLAEQIAEIVVPGNGRNNVTRDDRNRVINELSPQRQKPVQGSKAAPAKGSPIREQAGVY